MPRSKKPTDHLDAVKHLMGAMADHEIAVLANSTPSIVGRYRRRLGIEAYEGYKFGMGQEPPSRKEDEDEAAPAPVSTAAAHAVAAPKAAEPATRGPGRSKLDAYRDVIGKLPDAEVAAMANVTAEGVRIYRRRHDIPLTVTSRAGRKPKAAKAALAPTPAPAEKIYKPLVAKETAPAPAPVAPAAVEAPVKRKPGRPRKHPLPEPKAAPVSTAAVSTSAAATAPAAVTEKKKAAKTAPVAAKAAPVAAKAAATIADSKKPLRRASKLDPFGDFIGRLPDKEVAAMAGVTPENVRAFRRRHDIAAGWREDGDEGPSTPAVVAAPVKAEKAAPAPAVSHKEIDKSTPILHKAAPAAEPKAERVTVPAVVEPKAVAAPAPVSTAAVSTAAAPKRTVAAEAPSAAKLLNGYAIAVTAGDQKHEYIIVAADISSAALAAVKAVGGQHANAEITSIKHLGPALA